MKKRWAVRIWAKRDQEGGQDRAYRFLGVDTLVEFLRYMGHVRVIREDEQFIIFDISAPP